MSPEDQKQWEVAQLNQSIHFDYADIKIDPAPFQLVEKTPISKVHSLFTMLALRRAYVTQLGRLVGFVGLNELRRSIEDINNGNVEIKCVESQCSSPKALNFNCYERTTSNTSPDLAFTVSNDVEKSALINPNSGF